MRAHLESLAAERAAIHATPQELAELRKTAEEQYREVRDRKPGYLERIANINGKFHSLLQSAAQSKRLSSILKSLSDAPLVFETFRDYSNDELNRSARHHLEIVQALEAGDGNWAASVMRSHVLAARHTLASISDARQPDHSKAS
ncbi:MAG: GntR family transcriptional regulator [Woeseia sp.]